MDKVIPLIKFRDKNISLIHPLEEHYNEDIQKFFNLKNHEVKMLEEDIEKIKNEIIECNNRIEELSSQIKKAC